ncbi:MULTISPECIES: rhomboid-like protein [Streptomyces]|uniref:rhomboid-like protein n=1 Tax=Streptomyces TaxID=1883 RepID=UPI0004BDF876|nr:MULTISPECIES: rhomboid-like protein [Streptomyces]KJY23548.1 membrane protein [Streptomyces sp. NRRL S-104]KOU44670.1 membrane protein [Streptomyces sp. WM6373]KOU75239.1 membrane protein [Streptomyces sp. XY66]KOU76563.1 membrane protein [Streptomyces sp. IGB124]KOU98503.1 membrane protein [Streptomyces sp. XY58]
MSERTDPEPSRPLRSWIRSSPGTHIWLLIIAVTSIIVAIAPDQVDRVLLHRNSSNIHQLVQHPVRALVSSAFWIANPASLALYAVLFEVFHAPVERWLGTLRWLVIVATAHVVATLISQKVLLTAIQDHRAPRSMTHVVDIGVSYGLAASIGVLTYRLPSPWRWFYLAGAIAFFGIPLATGGTFTDLGHAIALAVGLLSWPLTRHAVSRETTPAFHVKRH